MSFAKKLPTLSRIVGGSLVLLGVTLAAPAVALPYIGPDPVSPSPLAGFGPFTYFYTETFDDHLVNSVGLTANTTTTASQGYSGALIDQAGLAGGCPAGGLATSCDTLFRASGTSGITLNFNAGALGGLPTVAGLVWTDGVNNVIFEAFDALGVSLGQITGTHAGPAGSYSGQIDEDRFYGVVNAGGISKLIIKASGGTVGIEIDNVQYGLQQTVPEPGSLALLALGIAGIAGIAGFGRRRNARR